MRGSNHFHNQARTSDESGSSVEATFRCFRVKHGARTHDHIGELLCQLSDYIGRAGNRHGDFRDWDTSRIKSLGSVERLISGADAYAGENPDFLDAGFDFFPCHRANPSFTWFE
jgi:hypothetical protein